MPSISSTPRPFALSATLFLFLVSQALLLAAPNILAEEFLQYQRMWPRLEQPWYFQTVTDVARGPDGSVFVLTAGGTFMGVHQFTRTGAFIRNWGGAQGNTGVFASPQAIAVSSLGDVFVADSGNDQVHQFDALGNHLRSWGSDGTSASRFGFPADIAIASDDTIHVIDSTAKQVAQFDRNGKRQSAWPVSGATLASFDFPGTSTVALVGLAVAADDSLYVSGLDNRIQHYSASGELLASWGGSGSGNGQFQNPGALVVAEDGTLFVADSLNHRVQQLSASGAWLGSWGEAGAEAENFSAPAGLAIGVDGNLLVADTLANRVKLYQPDGTLTNIWSSLGVGAGEFYWPKGIGTAPDGSVYVVDWGGSRVQRFDADGRYLGEWGSLGSANGQFKTPEGLAIAADGSVYIADTGNHRIQKFSANGGFLLAWGGQGTGNGQFQQPKAITAGQDGSVYVADWSGRLQKFTSQGAFVASVSGNLSHPSGIDIAANGDLYVTEGSAIKRFSAAGSYLGQLDTPTSIDGTLFYPVAIDIQADGTLYVANWLGHAIHHLNADGSLISSLGANGVGEGQFRDPYGISVNGNGRIYVADSKNNRVQVFQAVEQLSNAKAIIVAGGGPYQGNSLWSATLMNANFAYRALSAQGYGKENIRYLSHETELDLDANGLFDDVAATPSASSIQQAIRWAADADNLILYLVDHGGDKTFRISEDETLGADTLNGWLGALNLAGRITLVYDACYSGSFIDSLKSPRRTLISSAQTDASAYFLSQGAQSFSSHFWMAIFNGNDLRDAFASARDQMAAYQTAQCDVNGNGQPNESADLDAMVNAYLGAATDYFQQAPRIGAVSAAAPQAGASSLIASGVDDPDSGEVAQVWGVIIPPNYVAPNPDTPVLEMPKVHFRRANRDGDWSAEYQGFNEAGTYQIAVFAQDRDFNTSAPAQTRLVVDSPLSHKAVIFATGAADARWATIRTGADQAYDALRLQGIQSDSVRYFSPEGTSGTYGLATRANLEDALTRWALADAADVALYLVGPGDGSGLRLDAGGAITPSWLSGVLNTLLEQMQGNLTLLIDSDYAGYFIEAMTPYLATPAVVITGTGSYDPAPWPTDGASFSGYFWQSIANGSDIRDAYRNAQTALQLSGHGDQPLLDANGNGTGNEKDDLRSVRGSYLGNRILLAADAPHIRQGAADIALAGATRATLWAADIVSTEEAARLSVWAVIEAPYSSLAPAQLQLQYQAGEQRWQAEYQAFTLAGDYRVSIYARDSRGQTSLPHAFRVSQQTGATATIASFSGGLLDLPNVLAFGTRYQVRLRDQGNLNFVLDSYRALATDTDDSGVRYHEENRQLTIPLVAVGDQYYQARLEHQGDWLFRVLSATPATP